MSMTEDFIYNGLEPMGIYTNVCIMGRRNSKQKHKAKKIQVCLGKKPTVARMVRSVEDIICGISIKG